MILFRHHQRTIRQTHHRGIRPEASAFPNGARLFHPAADRRPALRVRMITVDDHNSSLLLRPRKGVVQILAPVILSKKPLVTDLPDREGKKRQSLACPVQPEQVNHRRRNFSAGQHNLIKMSVLSFPFPVQSVDRSISFLQEFPELSVSDPSDLVAGILPVPELILRQIQFIEKLHKNNGRIVLDRNSGMRIHKIQNTFRHAPPGGTGLRIAQKHLQLDVVAILEAIHLVAEIIGAQRQHRINAVVAADFQHIPEIVQRGWHRFLILRRSNEESAVHGKARKIIPLPTHIFHMHLHVGTQIFRLARLPPRHRTAIQTDWNPRTVPELQRAVLPDHRPSGLSGRSRLRQITEIQGRTFHNPRRRKIRFHPARRFRSKGLLRRQKPAEGSKHCNTSEY